MNSSLIKRVLFVAALAFLGTITESSLAASPAIETWWPVPGTALSGTQPFKALLQNQKVEDYEMFWQVDNGQWNIMRDDYRDWPHKEASVDLSGWNWRANGLYSLNFIARQNGQIIAQKSFTTYVENSLPLTQTNSLQPPVASSPPSSSITPDEPLAKISTNTGPSSAKPSITLINDYPVIDGNFIDCNGNIDNDPAHHTEDSEDRDPSHHVGKNCQPETLIGNLLKTAAQSPPALGMQIYAEQMPTGTIPSANPDFTPAAVSNITGQNLYIPYNSLARKWSAENQRDHPVEAALISKIADEPAAIWLGEWIGDVKNTVSSVMSHAENALPVFVAYNIPDRDCGGYSAGGTDSGKAYRAWIRGLKAGIENKKAVLILEPDALAGISCLPQDRQAERFSLLKDAVNILKEGGNTTVYIDAGHADWIPSQQMAERLTKAGVATADGFSLNVSNFATTQANIRYGEDVSSRINGKHFVIDTSRNGSGPTSNNEWCNPPGRSLGEAPTTITTSDMVDAFLWIKKPGESDGNCNGGMEAGTFWPEYAVDLARNAGW